MVMEDSPVGQLEVSMREKEEAKWKRERRGDKSQKGRDRNFTGPSSRDRGVRKRRGRIKEKHPSSHETGGWS